MNSKKKNLSWVKCNSNPSLNQEVLVLPPDILEKLGINLGSTQHSKEISYKKETLKENVHETKNSTNKECIHTCHENETSILETASLMKESVLLSPTFNTVKVDADSNELEIIPANKQTNLNDIKKNSKPLITNNIGGNCSNYQMNIENSCEISKVIETAKIRNEFILPAAVGEVPVNVSNEVPNLKSDLKKKINIISQEVLSIDRKHNLKLLKPLDPNNIISLKTDILLPYNKKTNKNMEQSLCSNSSTIEIISNNSCIPDELILDKSGKDVENKCENNKLSDLKEINNKDTAHETDRTIEKKITQYNQYDLQISLIKEEVDSHHDVQINQLNNESEGCNTMTHTDKLKIYSNSFQDPHNLPVFILSGSSAQSDNVDGNLNDIEEPNIGKDKEINANGNIAMSKLSIQGVEKPGGNIEFLKVPFMRTYSKREKSKVSNATILSMNSLEDNLQIESSEVTVKERSDLVIEQNFCLCEDFGCYTYTNNDTNYEHIHFWSRKPVCSLELFSSIYYENGATETNSSVETTESDIYLLKLNDNLPHDSHNGDIVCCNNLENVYKNVDLDILFPICKRAQNEQSIQKHSVNSKNVENINEFMDIGNEDVVANKLIPCDKIDKDNSVRGNISPNKSLNYDASVSNRFKERERLSTETQIPCKDNVTSSDKSMNRKRCITVSESDKSSAKKSRSADRIVCGVCRAKVQCTDWDNHVSSEHDFIAWKDGEKHFNLEDKNLFKKLEQRLSQTGKIICTFCDKELYDVTDFIDHVRICNYWRFTRNHQIVCGVCNTEVEKTVWIEHICKEHNYLAWEVGEPPLDLSDKDKIRSFLNITSKAIGGLECSNCGIKRKLIKCYIGHLKKCANIDIFSANENKKNVKKVRKESVKEITKNVSESNNETVIDMSTTTEAEEENEFEKNDTFKCGACQSDTDNIRWIIHIQEHNYLAWKEGDTPVNVNDEKEVYDHLYAMSKRYNGLICAKCGLRRKYVKAYLNHMKVCDGSTEQDTTFNDTVNESCVSDLNTTKSVLNESNVDNNNEEEIIECGVCHQQMQNLHWTKHIQKDHSYIAWKEGDSPINVDDEGEVHDHLYAMSKRQDGLICAKCGLRRKYVKSFLNHIKVCDGSVQHDTMNDSRASDLNESTVDDNDDEDTIECGVCHEQMLGKQWITHIQAEHSYLAWKEGRSPITDEKQVNDYLYTLSKRLEGLICAKCGVRRKYVKSFLSHIKTCDGSVQQDSSLYETFNSNNTGDLNESNSDDLENIECGVCHQQMLGKNWHQHIQKEHSYLAWKEGGKPIDFTIEQNVNSYLYDMNRKYDGLVCSKCGLVRKYVKSFLSHIQACDSTAYLDFPAPGGELSGDTCKCGVCDEVVDSKRFKSHAMLKHYNLAWRVGDYPIDVKNPYIVEKYLKEYKNKYKKFVCSLCGLVRVSCLGFYAHLLQCGKTEVELESLKLYCDKCDSKYLYLYKNQHLAMHREQELAKERKLSFEAKKLEPNEEIISGEGRMAAKKAKHVMEKYKSYDYNCTTCGYGADEEKELEEHSCRKMLYMDLSDSESSIKEVESTTDDEESEVDSNISDMEVITDKKKKHSESFSAASKIRRIPFVVQHPRTYLQKAAKEYFATYLSNNEMLYPLWRKCLYEIVCESQISQYLPPLEESCHLKLNKEDWTTLKKYEAKSSHGVSTIFAGSSIQSIAWSPGGGFLAASVHGAADTPRLGSDQLYTCANALQLWEFGPEEKSLPKFVLNIAHEYGLVWGMDWCPSGTTDVYNRDDQKSFIRLGLLAIACSNGYAYILSVPYPASIIDSDNKMCKLHAVAELRLSRGDQKFQATSISWSSQTGHTTILVGYSNGTTALYDLHSESPLLVDKKEDFVIYYPYHDEKTHSTCVTGVTTFPLKFSGSELVSSASPTGAETVRRAAAPARLRTHLATSAALHAPHWPSLLLAENDSIVNQAINELDWWCVGRRLGAMNSCSGCLHCGMLAAYSTPAIKLMKPHPVYSELHKDTVAIIDMVPLDKKISKQRNDDFAVKLEPLTYSQVIKSYGVELKFAKDLDRKTVQNLCAKEQCPERFPLSDIPSMAFNPSSKRHRQLAMATHSGFIFFFTV